MAFCGSTLTTTYLWAATGIWIELKKKLNNIEHEICFKKNTFLPVFHSNHSVVCLEVRTLFSFVLKAA